jgi:hypothetical protein
VAAVFCISSTNDESVKYLFTKFAATGKKIPDAELYLTKQCLLSKYHSPFSTVRQKRTANGQNNRQKNSARTRKDRPGTENPDGEKRFQLHYYG